MDSRLPQPPATGNPSSHTRRQHTPSAAPDSTVPGASYRIMRSRLRSAGPTPSAPAVAVGGWRAAYSSYVAKPLRPQRQPCALPQHEQPTDRSRGPVASPSVPPPSAHAPDAADASLAVVEGTPPTKVEPSATQSATPVTTSTAAARSCGASVIVPDVWGRVMEFLHVADWFFLANVCVCLDGVVADVARERRVSCLPLYCLLDQRHFHQLGEWLLHHTCEHAASMEQCVLEQLVFQVRHGVRCIDSMATSPSTDDWGYVLILAMEVLGTTPVTMPDSVWKAISLAMKLEIVERCAFGSPVKAAWFNGSVASAVDLPRLQRHLVWGGPVVTDFTVQQLEPMDFRLLPRESLPTSPIDPPIRECASISMSLAPSAMSTDQTTSAVHVFTEVDDDSVLPRAPDDGTPVLDLRHFVLWGRKLQITDVSLLRVAASSPRLSVLCVTGVVTCTDAGVVAICEACPLLQTVRINDTGGTLGDRSLFALAANAQGLEVLDVSSCCGAVTDAGLNAIAEHCGQLKALYLADSPEHVTDASLKNIIRRCLHLETIDATECRGVKDEAAKMEAEWRANPYRWNDGCV